MRKDLGSNIRALRKKAGLSQQELANKLGYKSSTSIAKIENGKNEPTMKILKELSDIFNVSMNVLVYGSNSQPTIKAVSIPILGRVIAGVPMEAVEEIRGYVEIPYTKTFNGDYFALEIKGDSMSPRFIESDVVIVKKQQDIESGDIAIVLVNGNEATCKKIKKTMSGVTLIPLNPAYEPMFYSNEEIESLPVRIIGKVVELRGRF